MRHPVKLEVQVKANVQHKAAVIKWLLSSQGFQTVFTTVLFLL